MARKTQPWGMKVIYHNRRRMSPKGERESLGAQLTARRASPERDLCFL